MDNLMILALKWGIVLFMVMSMVRLIFFIGDKFFKKEDKE